MGFFDNLGKNISGFSQATIQKGKDVASTAKYNRMISDEEKNISKLCESLGRRYCALHAADYEDSMAELMQEIQAAQERIKEYTDAIKELQGIIKCEKCGADIPNGAAFCPECGTPNAMYSDPAVSEAPVVAFCTNCGSQLTPGYKFCAACGAKVEVPDFPPAQPDYSSQSQAWETGNSSDSVFPSDPDQEEY